MTAFQTGRRGVGLALRWTALASGVILLSACENGQLPGFLQPKDQAAAPDGSGRSVKLVERDVEAPDVFQVTEAGLWDGRPSLGGVWVAHPDVTEPERVMIRNSANGKFVIGAFIVLAVAVVAPIPVRITGALTRSNPDAQAVVSEIFSGLINDGVLIWLFVTVALLNLSGALENIGMIAEILVARRR